MPLDKNSILQATEQGLAVFKHYFGHKFFRIGKSFKSPFYKDTKASCYVYLDRKSGVYKFKDYGDPQLDGDCFAFTGKLHGLSCERAEDFIRILEIIDRELVLNLSEVSPRVEKILRQHPGQVMRASALASIHDGFDTASFTEPLIIKAFSPGELDWWRTYGISEDVLNRYQVVSVHSFRGIGKSGQEYSLINTEQEPIYGYQGRRHTKLYRPFSGIRFLFTGEMSENYVFGYEQLPVRGDILFFTGGEKDVVSLAAHGFNAICMNSETAIIPKKLLRGLSYRFKHLVLLYDVDKTGLEAMERLRKEYADFSLKSLILPLAGDKQSKDISDFFRLGHSADDLRMLFVEMIELVYEDSITIMRTCEIDFDRPPQKSEPLVTINDVTVGAQGNLLCVSGAEGSGKTNYLGGILSGAIKNAGVEIDTLGTDVRENTEGQAVLLYDTEQSEYQLYKNLTHIVNRANLLRPPSWFRVYCLVGISRNERMQLILESMDKFFLEYGGIHLVIIDGIGDLLNGVNDEESSVALIEELFRLAAIYNTLVICVLHMAPSGLKLRGHLGSEVQRKAAGILLVEKDDDNHCSKIKALKVRDGSPLEVPTLQFGWSKEAGRHIFQGQQSKDELEKRKLEELQRIARAAFTGRSVLTATDINRYLMDTLDVKERMARNYFRLLRDHQIIQPSNQFPNNFFLNEDPQGA